MGLNSLLTASLLTASALVADAACVKRGDDSTASSGSSGSSGLVSATYFAGYHIDDGYTVDDVSWEKFTDVKYAFA